MIPGFDSMRMGARGCPPAYTIKNSIISNGSTSNQTFTPATDGNKQVYMAGGWFKRSGLGTTQYVFGDGRTTQYGAVQFNTSDEIYWQIGTESGSGSKIKLTNEKFRDVGAHMHWMYSVDTSEATPTDRSRFWINGVEITSWQTEQTITAVNTTIPKSANRLVFGARNSDTEFDGYMAQNFFIDGKSIQNGDYAITDFVIIDEDGHPIPVDLSLLAPGGTNSALLTYENDGALGEDSWGSNDFTVSNITQVLDTPTDSIADGTANWPKFNINSGALAAHTWSEGNTNVVYSATTSKDTIPFTQIMPSTGKWITAIEMIARDGNGANTLFGFVRTSGDPTLRGDTSTTTYMNSAYVTGPYKFTLGASSADTNELVNGDIVYLARWGDLLWMGKKSGGSILWFNSGNPAAGTNTFWVASSNEGPLTPAVCDTGTGGISNFRIKADVEATGVTLPSGFLPLNSFNLAANRTTTGILADHFSVNLRTGTSAAGSVVTTHSVEAVITKCRSNPEDWWWLDALRGVEKQLESNLDTAEQTFANSLTAFNSDGFDFGSYAGQFNVTGRTYVDYMFSMPLTDSGATTGAGTAKTYSTQYNPDLGFAVIEYTGNGVANHTIPLPTMTDPKAPFMVIHKKTSAAAGWFITHTGLTTYGLYRLKFDTAAETNTGGSDYWNSIAPTANVITLGTSSNVNANDVTYIVYVFWETDFCKPVNYTGNGNTDGALQNLGGECKFLIAKKLTVEQWQLRHTTNGLDPNPNGTYLYPAEVNVETTNSGQEVDFLSNGFKSRTSDSSMNSSGATYVGVAFVEPHPTCSPQLRAR